MKKKHFVKNRKKRNVVLLSFLFLFVLIGIGYSTLGTVLHIGGHLFVSRVQCDPGNSLYEVLACEAKGGLAKEYTGAHRDSYTVDPTEKIYHYYAKNDSEGTAIQNKNNVIFDNMCWQMIRTTDTGGVKMIYNGDAEDGKCLDTRGNHLGINGFSKNFLNGQFGTDFSYDPSTKQFTIAGRTLSYNSPISDYIGSYMCRGDYVNTICTNMLAIQEYNSLDNRFVFQPLNTNSHYSQFGKQQFDDQLSVYYCSPANVGYMRGERYDTQWGGRRTDTLLDYSYLSTSYWYADSYSYGSNYSLVSPYKVTDSSEYSSLVGKYTLRNSSETGTSSSVYYIVGVDDSEMYYILLSDGNSLESYNTPYVYGNSYIESAGTFTIQNPTTVYKFDLLSHQEDLVGKYVCKNAVDNSCSSLINIADISSDTYFDYISSTDNYTFASSFTYDSTTNKYTLSGNSYTMWDFADEENVERLNHMHYTCLNTTGECSTLNYIFAYTYPVYNYYELKNGQDIDNLLENMLSNTADSQIKFSVDVFYKKFFAGKAEDYIEDTIFCNNRSFDLKGFDSTNSLDTYYFTFEENDREPDLSCPRVEDQLSVSNPNATLTYPVGLMTASEMKLLNNNNARSTGQAYFTMSPAYFGTNNDYGVASYMKIVKDTGEISTSGTDGMYGVRPAISLKPGTTFISGDGSKANPYVTDTPFYKLTIHYNDLTTNSPLILDYVGYYVPYSTYSIESPTPYGKVSTNPVVAGTITRDNTEIVVNYTAQ